MAVTKIASAFLFPVLAIGAWTLTPRATAQQDSSQQTAPAADNTRMNKGDQNAGQPTADRQMNDTSDRDTTKNIRRAIMQDTSLSTYAHNVKIITRNGQVTLRGPVRSDEEKKAVESKAAEVAGADKVTNQLDVKPSR